MPASSGAIAYQPADTRLIANCRDRCGSIQVRQKKKVKFEAKYCAISSQRLADPSTARAERPGAPESTAAGWRLARMNRRSASDTPGWSAGSSRNQAYQARAQTTPTAPRMTKLG